MQKYINLAIRIPSGRSEERFIIARKSSIFCLGTGCGAHLNMEENIFIRGLLHARYYAELMFSLSHNLILIISNYTSISYNAKIFTEGLLGCREGANPFRCIISII